MKKITSVLLASVMLLTLYGCGFEGIGDISDLASLAGDYIGEDIGEGIGSSIQSALEGSFKDSTIDSSYDFSGLGLSAEVEKALVLMAEKKAGVYTLGDHLYIKCPNSDYIIDEGDKITAYTHGDYCFYEIFSDTYNLTRFTSSYKYDYYMRLYLVSTMFTFLTETSDSVPDNAASYISSRVKLLSAGEHHEDIEGNVSLANYTEYSGAVNTDYLFTTYMHPETRKFDWLAPYASKIKCWTVAYIDDIWLEDNVSVQFSYDVTTEELQEIHAFLKGKGLSGASSGDIGEVLGGLSAEDIAALEGSLGDELPEGFLENLTGALGGSDNPMGGMYSFEGELSIYTMPFKDEGDNWYDDYKLTGSANKSIGMPFTLNAQYLYKYWYDGGSNATYVRRMDGLYRSTPDSGCLVIDAEGNHIPYDYETGLPVID